MSDFDTFWLLYPRKCAKGAARRAYGCAVKKASHQAIMDGLGRYTAFLARSGKAPEYVKHPATWLNGECWLDELPGQENGERRTGTAEDRAYARVIAAGQYMPNVSEHRVVGMVRLGLLTADLARKAGYLI